VAELPHPDAEPDVSDREAEIHLVPRDPEPPGCHELSGCPIGLRVVRFRPSKAVLGVANITPMPTSTHQAHG
jgi:hypothetical protein